MLITKESVLNLTENNITSLIVFFYFQVAFNYLTYFTTNSWSIIVDNFGKW